MKNLTPLSSMSQRGRSPDAALVFSLIFVWINVQAVLCGGACSQSVNLISVEVGHTARLPPCGKFQSDSILSVTWGNGSCPTDKTIIIERNHNNEDGDTNEHFSVDEKYRLVIKNYSLDDAVEYWCQVTPRKTTGCNCSRTLKVKQVTSKPLTSKQIQHEEDDPITLLMPTSSAEQTFFQFQVFRNLCLLSGILWLTNVGGMG